MNSETNVLAESYIPTQWPTNYAFRLKDGLAMVSSCVSLMIPLFLAFHTVTRALGLPDIGPARGQSNPAQAVQFMVATVFTALIFCLAGKYLWLLCMCRLLDRANVGPAIAYGIPRRISAFDRRFVLRFYRDAGPAFETRLVPEVSAVRLFWYLPATFATGAIISFGAAYFHLVANEQRFWQNGFACILMAAVLGIVACWLRRISH